MDLFVSGFPLDLDEEKLIKLFAIYGISVKSAKIIIKDHDTGFSKGFGVVAIEDDEEAEEAINKLDGEFIEGSKLTVEEARPVQFVYK